MRTVHLQPGTPRDISFLCLFNVQTKEWPLPAPALLHHHVLVLFVHHVVAWVYVQDADGAEFGGDAAAGRGAVGVHWVHERLYDGVVGGLQVWAEREVAHPLAVVRLVIQGRDDPVVPSQLLEIHVQPLFAAAGFRLLPVPLPVPVAQRGPAPTPGPVSLNAPRRRPLLLRGPHRRRLIPLAHRPPRLDLLLHLVEQVLPLLGAGVGHQDGLLLLGPAAPVQPQLPQVHLGVGFAESDPELEAELVSLLVVMVMVVVGMMMRVVIMMLVRFKRFPHVQNLPAGFGGVERVQGPGVQQPVRAAGVDLDVVEARRLQGGLQIPGRPPEYP